MGTPGRTFRVLLRLQVRDGAGFERAWLAVGDSVTGHPANLGQWLMRDTADDAVYYIISDWTDEASFREFEHSRVHVWHREQLHPYRESGSMATMSVVHHLSPGGQPAEPETEPR
jgi:heme oxygenase (mycobilin-producing)